MDYTISIGIEDADNYPYEYMNGNILTGFHVDFINQVASQTKFKINWVRLPWSRAVNDFKNGKVDALTYLSKNKEREEFTLFLENNFLRYNYFCLVSNNEITKDFKFDGKLSSLKGHSVGLIPNYYLSDELDKVKGLFKIVYFMGDAGKAIELLLNNRFEFTFTSKEYFDRFKKNNLKDIQKVTLHEPCFITSPIYLGFSKKEKDKAEAFGAAMIKFRNTKAYNDLLKKYSITSDL